MPLKCLDVRSEQGEELPKATSTKGGEWIACAPVQAASALNKIGRLQGKTLSDLA